MPANPIGLVLRNRHAGHQTLVWARPDMQAPEKPATHALTIGIRPIAKRHSRERPDPTQPDPRAQTRQRRRRPPRLGRSQAPALARTTLVRLPTLRPALQLGLPDKFTLADALHAMTGHVIGRARLDGTYEIR
jgi:hypothetical protein